MDAILAVYIWKDQGHFWLYAMMAAAGSAVGGLLPYGLGRAGGELFLLKRVNRERFESMRKRFENQEFWAVAIPSMLPPPTPWKVFVFAAGVFEMRVILFMLAVFTGAADPLAGAGSAGHQAGAGSGPDRGASRADGAGGRRGAGGDWVCLVVDA